METVSLHSFCFRVRMTHFLGATHSITSDSVLRGTEDKTLNYFHPQLRSLEHHLNLIFYIVYRHGEIFKGHVACLA